MASNPILELVAAMERAKRQNGTDEEEAILKPRRDYTHALEDTMHKWHTDNGGPLDTHDCLLGLAIALGLAIRCNTYGKLGALTTLLELRQVLTEAAVGDISE